jgi:mannose-6-phosphate isomerase-like protein (cupin superfamily)
MNRACRRNARVSRKAGLLLLWAASGLLAQERKVDPTWLHRQVPLANQANGDQSSGSCRYTPIFGEGDPENRILRSVTRFGQITLATQGKCENVLYDHEEQLYFVLEGAGILNYADETHPMRTKDFTYLAPGVKHSIANPSDKNLRVLVMGFKIPPGSSISTPSAQPRIVNLDDVKEETVAGHPTSVLYKLLVGSRGAKRDAIDDAYVVTSLFLMDFAPGGTNFPHHHETEEEIYLVLDGQGEMAAGSGLDGIAGRYPAQAGDAYYFRANCTVGFYNQNQPGAKAHILAVRSRIPLPTDTD